MRAWDIFASPCIVYILADIDTNTAQISCFILRDIDYLVHDSIGLSSGILTDYLSLFLYPYEYTSTCRKIVFPFP